MTSCFCFAASIPPFSPRHDITVALGASPPSRISSQPMIWRPWSLRNFSIWLITKLCRRSSLLCLSSDFKPSALIRAWHFGHFSQRTFGHSSPPTWIYSEGKIAINSVNTSSRNFKTWSFPAQSTSSDTPHCLHTSYGPPVHPNSGYAARAACICPGRSISGITVI